MKRIIGFILLCTLCFSITGCTKTYHGTDELIEKARKEIPISEADSIEIQYAGMRESDNKAIAWFISGNEYQTHYYLPMEIEIKGNGTNYSFVRVYKPMELVTDIAAIEWNGGYCFLINNPECVEVEIYDYDGTYHRIPIEKDTYPYIIYWDTIISQYGFLDADGNCL